eukprot:6391848-Amphidinium_carterae.1
MIEDVSSSSVKKTIETNGVVLYDEGFRKNSSIVQNRKDMVCATWSPAATMQSMPSLEGVIAYLTGVEYTGQIKKAMLPSPASRLLWLN